MTSRISLPQPAHLWGRDKVQGTDGLARSPLALSFSGRRQACFRGDQWLKIVSIGLRLARWQAIPSGSAFLNLLLNGWRSRLGSD